MKATSARSDEQYLSFDPYAGNESDVKCKRVSIVKTRFPQFCTFCNREHPAGTRMRVERAKVDDTFQSNYCCLESIDNFLADEDL